MIVRLDWLADACKEIIGGQRIRKLRSDDFLQRRKEAPNQSSDVSHIVWPLLRLARRLGRERMINVKLTSLIVDRPICLPELRHQKVALVGLSEDDATAPYSGLDRTLIRTRRMEF